MLGSGSSILLYADLHDAALSCWVMALRNQQSHLAVAMFWQHTARLCSATTCMIVLAQCLSHNDAFSLYAYAGNSSCL